MTVVDRIRAALAGTIEELKAARRTATAELISFKAGQKLAAARADELAAKAAEWQARAESALRAGDEPLAREALVRRGETIAELARVRADTDEQGRIAAALLRGRREVDAKLAQLEARQGTIAAGLAAGQGATPLQAEGPAWDRLADAERRLDLAATEHELSEGELDAAALAGQKLDHLDKESRAEDALAALKRKMRGGDEGT